MGKLKEWTKNWKLVLLLALPSVISFATQTVSGTASLIMVGKLGAVVIAIVGLANVIIYNAWALFSGLGHTVNYLVSQNYGEGDMKKGVERTFIAVGISAAMGLLVFVLGYFSGDLIRLMGGSAEMSQQGAGYLRIRFFALAFGIVTSVIYGFFRAIGDTRTPMLIAIFANAVMIVVTYALIFGKLGFGEYGLAGAGYGVLVSEVSGFLAAGILLVWKLRTRFRSAVAAPRDGREAKLMAKEAGKLGFMEFSMSAAMLIFTMVVVRLGETALAANEIALNVMAFGFMPAIGFGSTATILVGQEIGKGNPKLARRYGTDSAVLGSLFILLLGTVEVVFAKQIGRFYSPEDREVALLAAHLIQISAYLQLFDGWFNLFAGGLRGVGDTSFLMKAGLVTGWLLFVPMAYGFTIWLGWGSYGAWISLYLYLLILGTVLLVRYYRTPWSEVRLVRAN